MHELSIAHSLVSIAEDAIKGAGVTRVEVVHLKLGALSGVVRDALLFAYDVATEGTALAGSRLEIEDVPVVVYCPTCDAERTLESIQLFCCPVCDTPTADIRQGREIELISLECESVESDEHATTHS